jgi:hypothetical protein
VRVSFFILITLFSPLSPELSSKQVLSDESSPPLVAGLGLDNPPPWMMGLQWPEWENIEFMDVEEDWMFVLVMQPKYILHFASFPEFCAYTTFDTLS